MTLSASEAELLAVLAVLAVLARLARLARRPGKVVTRRELLEAVFDPADVADTVDTYVYFLRRKLGSRSISTVYGIGYSRAGRSGLLDLLPRPDGAFAGVGRR